MQDFQQLSEWRKAHCLVLPVYTACGHLPASESFGFFTQLRRSAISIPRLIAQGSGSDSNQEFALDLRKARAAAHELESILLPCRDLDFFSAPLHAELHEELIEVRKTLSGLLAKVATSEPVR